MKIRGSNDLYSGMMFFLCGLAAVLESSHYRLGTASRMGPGYFPTLVGGFLAVLGLVMVIRAVLSPREMVALGGLRPLLMVIAAIISFGALVQSLGLVVATIAMIVVSCLAGRELHLKEGPVLCLVLVIIAVFLFAWGLGIPFKVWPV